MKDSHEHSVTGNINLCGT